MIVCVCVCACVFLFVYMSIRGTADRELAYVLLAAGDPGGNTHAHAQPQSTSSCLPLLLHPSRPVYPTAWNLFQWGEKIVFRVGVGGCLMTERWGVPKLPVGVPERSPPP